jgi:Uma2 family endonuclease
MSGATARRRFTRADFLSWEERQPGRHEYLDGVIVAMAGGTQAHDVIAGNMFAALHSALRGSRCRPFQHNRKLVPRETEDVTYPDVMVVCKEAPDEAVAADEATVIVEVLSTGSRAGDYDRKWGSYRMIAALRHYVVVEQDKPVLTSYSRPSEADPWREERLEGLDASLALEAIGTELTLRAIYENTAVAVAR